MEPRLDSSAASSPRLDLVEALRVLASPYEVQIQTFPEWVVVADEIALLFDDAYELIDRRALPPDADVILNRIDGELGAASRADSRHLWTLDAMQTSAYWSNLRKEALRGLGALHEVYTIPRPVKSYVQDRRFRFRMPRLRWRLWRRHQ